MDFDWSLEKVGVMLIMTSAIFWLVYSSHDEVIKGSRKRRGDYVTWMISMFDRMFMAVSARQCVLMILASVTVTFAIVFFLTQGMTGSFPKHVSRVVILLVVCIGPLGLPTGWNLPRVILNRMWKKRVETFDEQMLDALVFLSNSLKSGMSLMQGFEMVSDELPDPVSQEFSLILSQQRLGVRFDEALSNLEERIGTDDVQIVVTSINILRESGGNLSEVFDTISTTMRQRRKVEAKIRSLTAQGVIQGQVVVAMPFVLGYVLHMMDPDLMRRMWTTNLGLFMCALILVFQGVGYLIIKKLVTIEV